MADVFIPQDIDYPALQLDVDRMRASELGLDQQEVVGNVITALTSNQMIAPSFWIDPKTGNDYMLTVQYPEAQMQDSERPASHSAARRRASLQPTRLDMISTVTRIKSPTEVDHYQLRRAIDIYVRPLNEDLGRIANSIDEIIARHQDARGPQRDAARHGAGHARVVPQLRARAVPGGGAAVSDPGGAVPVVSSIRSSFCWRCRPGSRA